MRKVYVISNVSGKKIDAKKETKFEKKERKFILIYLLTAVGLSPGGSTHLHTNNTQNNANKN